MTKLSIKIFLLFFLVSAPAFAGTTASVHMSGANWWFGVNSGSYCPLYGSGYYTPHYWSPWRPRASYDWWRYEAIEQANLRTVEEITRMGEIKKQIYDNAKARGELEPRAALPQQAPELTAPQVETIRPSEI